MQRPTCTNIQIHSTRDAMKIFYGVAIDMLPIIDRRLDADERKAIQPGNVYVWQDKTGSSSSSRIPTAAFERWTDGLSWGPSRVKDDFFFYIQKDQRNEALPRTISWHTTPGTPTTQSSLDDQHRLVKQTFSVYVTLPIDNGALRKWHLTAYFTKAALRILRRPDALFNNQDVSVPEGWFQSAKSGSRIPPPPFKRSLTEDEIHEQRAPSPALSSMSNRSRGIRPHLSRRRSDQESSSESLSDSSTTVPPLLYSPRDAMKKMTYPLAPSDFVDISPTFSSSSTSEDDRGLTSKHKLIPLAQIDTMTAPPRDPFDQQLLLRFCPVTPLIANGPLSSPSSASSWNSDISIP